MSEKKRVETNIKIENARIGFKNFSGKEGQFNPAGRRNFCVFLEDDLARILQADGWNVRWLEPKDDGDEPVPYLQAAVSFDPIPPKIMLVTRSGMTQLDAATVEILDFADIESVDLVLNPYNWSMKNGSAGVKAYVKVMYVTIAEDAFEDKYHNAPDSAIKCVGPNCPIND